jgi:hypothetical protein
MTRLNNRYWKITVLFLVILIIPFGSCNKNPTGPTSLPDSRPMINAQEYGNLVLQMIDYDVVQITHQAGFVLRSPNVIRIGVGSKEVSGFRLLLASVTTYDSILQNYIIHFDFTVRMDSSKIIAPLTVRYYSSDSTYTDADTMIALYKYPYPSAEIFLDSTNLSNQLIKSMIDGISLSGTTFFFHPLNDGLYAYDLETHDCIKRWDGYYRGSHIAADSSFVFCDINHQQIARYNLTTNTADISLPELGNIIAIDGMAIFNHSLYVLIAAVPEYLKKFTLNGVLLDSISFSNYPQYSPYFMAMYDSVIYSKDENTRNNPDGVQVSRFNLRTKGFLSNVYSPAREIGPITISGGKLYYNNLYKTFIGVVPIADLFPVQTRLNQAIYSPNHHRAPNKQLH